jgi:hypothetical protein
MLRWFAESKSAENALKRISNMQSIKRLSSVAVQTNGVSIYL